MRRITGYRACVTDLRQTVVGDYLEAREPQQRRGVDHRHLSLRMLEHDSHTDECQEARARSTRRAGEEVRLKAFSSGLADSSSVGLE